MFCQQCGTEVLDTARFCPQCGADLKPTADTGTALTPVSIVLLSLTLVVAGCVTALSAIGYFAGELATICSTGVLTAALALLILFQGKSPAVHVPILVLALLAVFGMGVYNHNILWEIYKEGGPIRDYFLMKYVDFVLYSDAWTTECGCAWVVLTYAVTMDGHRTARRILGWSALSVALLTQAAIVWLCVDVFPAFQDSYLSQDPWNYIGFFGLIPFNVLFPVLLVLRDHLDRTPFAILCGLIFVVSLLGSFEKEMSPTYIGFSILFFFNGLCLCAIPYCIRKPQVA